MGIEPFLVASTLEGVMAQRLVRTICKQCKQEYCPAEVDVPADFPRGDDGKPLTLWKGAGCRACHQTGYFGRTGIYELLVTNAKVHGLCVQRTDAVTIRNQAIQDGMRTLRQDGWRKVAQGQTTLEEVARVTKGDIIFQAD